MADIVHGLFGRGCHQVGTPHAAGRSRGNVRGTKRTPDGAHSANPAHRHATAVTDFESILCKRESALPASQNVDQVAL